MKRWEWVFIAVVLALFFFDSFRARFGPKPTVATFQPVGMAKHTAIARHRG